MSVCAYASSCFARPTNYKWDLDSPQQSFHSIIVSKLRRECTSAHSSLIFHSLFFCEQQSKMFLAVARENPLIDPSDSWAEHAIWEKRF